MKIEKMLKKEVMTTDSQDLIWDGKRVYAALYCEEAKIGFERLSDPFNPNLKLYAEI